MAKKESWNMLIRPTDDPHARWKTVRHVVNEWEYETQCRNWMSAANFRRKFNKPKNPAKRKSHDHKRPNPGTSNQLETDF